MLVLDTHVLVWAHQGTRLSARVQKRLAAEAERQELFVSAITPWEIALSAHRGYIRVVGNLLEWIRDSLDGLGVAVMPLDLEMAVDAVELGWEHNDPADRIIVATARHLGADLATADTVILDYAAASRAVRVLEV